MRINISVDPGTNGTGVCIWIDGKVKDKRPITLRPHKECRTFAEKCISLKHQFASLCEEVSVEDSNGIDTVAFEEFEYHHNNDDEAGPKKAKASMVKCATVRGVLLAVADDWACKKVFVSKGTIRKTDTRLFAQAYGIQTEGRGKPSKDALDAFQIGVCAGFDRGPR